jgi:DNA-binding SARP family transcriptional activator
MSAGVCRAPNGRAADGTTPDRVSTRFALRLLRDFELQRQGKVVQLPMSTQRLVAFLALRGRPTTRIHVASTLWIDGSEDHAKACLRTALWRLRRLSATMVDATSTQLALSETVAVDVRDAAVRATEVLHGDAGSDRSVVALSYTGELLPDWYDDWVLIERERLCQLIVYALERISTDARRAGRFAESTEAALAAVAHEPLRESAHRLVIESHLANGNPGEAIRQYRLFSRLLRGHLGLEPSPLMRRLIAGLVTR